MFLPGSTDIFLYDEGWEDKVFREKSLEIAQRLLTFVEQLSHMIVR